VNSIKVTYFYNSFMLNTNLYESRYKFDHKAKGMVLHK